MKNKKRRLLPSELTVRPASLDDRELLGKFVSDERIAEMNLSGFTEVDEATLNQVLSSIDEGWMKGWFVELPGFGPVSFQLYTPSGTPGVWSGDTINAPGVVDLEVSWIGTASMAVALDALFADPEVHRLCGHVAVTNPASLSMCDRLGFVREGIARDQMPIGQGLRADAVVMAMLRREWCGSAELEWQVTS